MAGSTRPQSTEDLSPNRDDKFRRFFMESADMLGIVSIGGRYLEVNEAFERVLGYSIQDLIGTPALELVHPDDQEVVAKQVEGLVQGLQLSTPPAIRMRHCDGSYRWMGWTATRSLPKGEFYVVIRDITQHRQQDERLAPKLTS